MHAPGRVLLATAAVVLAGCSAGPGPGTDGSDGPVDATLHDPIFRFEYVDAEGRPGPRGEDEYWMVRVSGAEDRRPRWPGVNCSSLKHYGMLPGEQSLSYNRGLYDLDRGNVTAVLAIYHGRRKLNCSLAEVLVPDATVPATVHLGRAGNVTFEVLGDGTVVVDAHGASYHVSPGRAGRGSYVASGVADGENMEHTEEEGTVYRYEGTFRVENLGAWPRANITSFPG